MAARYDVAAHWDGLSWSASLEHTPTEGVLVYGSVRTGFKAGGFNTDVAQREPFGRESLTAWEVGVKTRGLAGRLRVEASAFWYDYRDIQVNVLPVGASPLVFPAVANAAAATVRGLDLSASALAAPGLTLDGAVTLLDARYDEFMSADPNDRLASPDQSGNRLPNAPRLTARVAARRTWAVPGLGEASLGADCRIVSSTWFSSFADPAVRESGYAVVNARAQVGARDGGWFAALFVRNALDRTYAVNRIRADGSIGVAEFLGQPRTYGVQLGMRW